VGKKSGKVKALPATLSPVPLTSWTVAKVKDTSSTSAKVLPVLLFYTVPPLNFAKHFGPPIEGYFIGLEEVYTHQFG
jgi:hypothetical protein